MDEAELRNRGSGRLLALSQPYPQVGPARTRPAGWRWPAAVVARARTWGEPVADGGRWGAARGEERAGGGRG